MNHRASALAFAQRVRGFEVEELHLMSDDGGGYVFIDGDECFIASQDCVLGRYDEPDMLIWRTEDDFETWYDEVVNI